MSYEPTVWSEGDFITADKLNERPNPPAMLGRME